MVVHAYLELPEETEESMGYIVKGIDYVVSESGIPGLSYENDPKLNSDGRTWNTRISVYNFPDEMSVLEFSDRVSDKLRMPFIFKLERVSI